MNTDNPEWPPIANQFMHRYAEFERHLKLAGHVKKGRKDAQADWTKLAAALDASFFKAVCDSGAAKDLINEPPRTRMAHNLAYEPAIPKPLANVEELFVRGVSKVRHNLAHGEKFDVTGLGWQRDERLVSQALHVLDRAAERIFLPGELLGPAIR